jgi:hypothetical protein
MLPVLEGILSEFGRRKNVAGSRDPAPRPADASGGIIPLRRVEGKTL